MTKRIIQDEFEIVVQDEVFELLESVFTGKYDPKPLLALKEKAIEDVKKQEGYKSHREPCLEKHWTGYEDYHWRIVIYYERYESDWEYEYRLEREEDTRKAAEKKEKIEALEKEIQKVKNG